MNNFRFNIPTEILFGKNQIKYLSQEVSKYSKATVLIVCGRGSVAHIVERCEDLLTNTTVILSGVMPNPRINKVREGIDLCKKHHVDFILAIGGGSVIDTAKAIAVGFYHNDDPWTLFASHQRPPHLQALPLGCILTLSGTGSEMNGNAVLSNPEIEEKKSFSIFEARPKFSICDPTYTYTVPAMHTAAGVADTMSHIFEQYFSPTTGAFVQDGIAEALLKTCVHYGPVAIKDSENYEARANLMWASSIALNSMISLGKRTDWVTHAIEHELSSKYDVTHGVGLAILHPAWIEYVVDDSSLFPEEARPEFLRPFFKSLGLPTKLSDIGIGAERFEEMAEGAINVHGGGSIGGYKKLDKNDIIRILNLI
jgi:butanol dehydrogenase